MNKHWYLAGPMSGIENGNVEMFLAAAHELRLKGYAIVNPVELDTKEQLPPAGDYHPSSETWRDFLRRDLAIIMNEECVGIICLPGWEKSRGALLETYVGKAFDKSLLLWDGEALIVLDRTRYLTAMNRIDKLISPDEEDEAFDNLVYLNSFRGGR
jgi:hypothetical protein